MRIRLQTQAGVQEFGQLHFPYNGANDKIDIVSVKVTKPNGAVTVAGADSVQDLTAPVAREAPIYSDLHQKDIVVPGLAAGDVLANCFEIALIQPEHPFEVAWVADVHRVRDGLLRRARLERAARQILRHDVVDVRRRNEPPDRRSRSPGHESRGEIAEIAAGHREGRARRHRAA